MVVVGDLIGQFDDLGFEAWLRLTESSDLGLIIIGAVFGNPFTYFPCEVQAGEIWISILKEINHAKTLEVMFETS